MDVQCRGNVKGRESVVGVVGGMVMDGAMVRFVHDVVVDGAKVDGVPSSGVLAWSGPMCSCPRGHQCGG